MGDKLLEDEKKVIDRYLFTLFNIDLSDKCETIIKVK